METDLFKKQFGNEASSYTKYRRPYPTELYKLLFSLLPPNSQKILDLGCGTGKSTEPLLTSGLEVFGCDHDPLMITEATKQAELKNLSIDYQVGTAESLPYPDNTFDVVTVGTAFHFFVNDKSLTEIKRVLKSGGLFFTFWTLTTKEIPVEDEIPASIYQAYNIPRIPPPLRDLNNIAAFLTASGLHNVSTDQIPFSYQTSIEERVGLQKTSGTYELLSEENKKNFLREIETALKEKLKDRPYFTLEEEIQICYGFK